MKFQVSVSTFIDFIALRLSEQIRFFVLKCIVYGKPWAANSAVNKHAPNGNNDCFNIL